MRENERDLVYALQRSKIELQPGPGQFSNVFVQEKVIKIFRYLVLDWKVFSVMVFIVLVVLIYCIIHKI